MIDQLQKRDNVPDEYDRLEEKEANISRQSDQYCRNSMIAVHLASTSPDTATKRIVRTTIVTQTKS